MYTDDDERWYEGAKEARGYYPPKIEIVDRNPDHYPSTSDIILEPEANGSPTLRFAVRDLGFLVLHECSHDTHTGRIDWGVSLVTNGEIP